MQLVFWGVLFDLISSIKTPVSRQKNHQKKQFAFHFYCLYIFVPILT